MADTSFKMRIIHVSTVHYRYDTRIYLKMCCFLAQNKIDVKLFVADGQGDEFINGVHIQDVGLSKNRLIRIFYMPIKMFFLCLNQKHSIFHLHDPELLPLGFVLKLLNKKVVFDSHEDIPNSLYSKHYIKFPFNFILSKLIKYFLELCLPFFDFTIAATSTIKESLPKSCNILIVNNYPIFEELITNNNDIKRLKSSVCYVGTITEPRGIIELCKASNLFYKGITLEIVGKIDKEMKYKLDSLTKLDNIKYHGFLDRNDLAILLSNCFAGIVTFHNYPNHINSQPNKLFEYMSAGLATICSDFPLWRKLISNHNCGILVDPMSPYDIAQAVNRLFDEKSIAFELGTNGKSAVFNHYNWNSEFKNLLELYHSL